MTAILVENECHWRSSLTSCVWIYQWKRAPLRSNNWMTLVCPPFEAKWSGVRPRSSPSFSRRESVMLSSNLRQVLMRPYLKEERHEVNAELWRKRLLYQSFCCCYCFYCCYFLFAGQFDVKSTSRLIKTFDSTTMSTYFNFVLFIYSFWIHIQLRFCCKYSQLWKLSYVSNNLTN